MAELNALSVVNSAMTRERQAIAGAGYRLSLANMTFSSEAAAKTFLENMQVSVIDTQGIAVKSIYDPSHVNASDNGIVFSFGVDPASEMVKMTVSKRAYEANVKSFNTIKEAYENTLNMGR